MTTHDIGELCEIFPNGIRLPISADDQDLLTDYATVSRYPGEIEPITRQEAEHAVRLARTVRKAVPHLLKPDDTQNGKAS